jgi:hypothetical protein
MDREGEGMQKLEVVVHRIWKEQVDEKKRTAGTAERERAERREGGNERRVERGKRRYGDRGPLSLPSHSEKSDQL